MAYKQKSSPLNKGVKDAETMNAPIDNRMGNVTGRSFMSQHSKSSPLHAEKTAKERLAEAKEARKAPGKAVRDARKDVKTENKTTRQNKRTASKQKFKGEAAAAKTATDATRISDKAGRVEKRQVGKDYRKAKSDIKTGERQEWSDATNQDSDSGLSSYKVKGKVKLDRKAIKKQAGDEATKKAAKRAKK
mgnify:CR=1 FL=1